MAAAPVLALLKNFQQRSQMAGPQRARPADFVLLFGQIGRQPSLAQYAPGPGTQFPQIELLGLAMLQVIIPAGAAIAGGQAHRLKTASPVTGPPALALIDVALHQDYRMAPVRLPVSVEPLQTQPQHARGQIGIALALGQNQKTAVVPHEAQPPSPLAGRPPN